MADRVAAFLDFDRTLVDCDAGVVFGRSLAAQRFQDLQDEPLLKRWVGYVRLGGALLWLVLQEGVFRFLHAIRIVKRSTLVKRAYRFFRGLRADYVYRRMEEVFHDQVAGRFYPGMLDEIDRHRADGHEIVIVTTGMKPLVEHARRYLGEVEIIACDLVEEEGELTGRVRGPLWGLEKREAIEGYAEEHGIDLSESWAYSDHVSDVAFLEAVGHPVAVNPDGRLRKVAEARGWRILEALESMRPDEREAGT